MSGERSEDREIADLALREARETLNKQLDVQSDIDSNAARILRINTVLLGITISGVSLLLDGSAPRATSGVFNAYTATGLVLLLLSTALAALTYSASDSVVGVSRDDIEELVDGDHSEIEYKDGLAIAFGEWIAFNSETIDIDAFYFTSTTTSLVWALSFLGLGVVNAIGRPIQSSMLFSIAGALLAFTYSTEWWSQFRRWLDLVEPMSRAKRFLLSGSDR